MYMHYMHMFYLNGTSQTKISMCIYMHVYTYIYVCVCMYKYKWYPLPLLTSLGSHAILLFIPGVYRKSLQSPIQFVEVLSGELHVMGLGSMCQFGPVRGRNWF